MLTVAATCVLEGDGAVAVAPRPAVHQTPADEQSDFERQMMAGFADLDKFCKLRRVEVVPQVHNVGPPKSADHRKAHWHRDSSDDDNPSPDSSSSNSGDMLLFDGDLAMVPPPKGAVPPVPPVPVAPESDEAGPPGPPLPPPPMQPRLKRAHAWGIFEVAEVRSHGELIGFGGNCRRHCNPDDGPRTICKVQLTFGKSNPLSVEETRCRVKFWCILGWLQHGELEATPAPRTSHLALRPRDLDVTMTEVEMDAFVEGMLVE